MALDPKLREVLDTLSEEPAKARPKEEREYLVSVLRRLNIREVPKPAPPTPAVSPPAAYAREEELRLLREQQERDEEALRAIQAERDALRERQAELESRLARLEAGNQAGLSYEEPEPIVEFTRVDFPARVDDELMEFETIPDQGAFAAPDAGAWSTSEPSWETEEPAWNDDAPGAVDWDADEAPTAPAASARAPTATDPLQSWEDDSAAPQDKMAGMDDLDERTKSDLAELEAQLAELERELAKRDETARRRNP